MKWLAASVIAVGAVGVAAVLVINPAGSSAVQPTPAPASAGPTTPDDAPWPTMRANRRNTGAVNVPGKDPGTSPWSFTTARGIFSTPVVDQSETIYVGSADENLYALSPRGREQWRFPTGGIIDTAPALLQSEPGVGPTLTVGSGDAQIYKLRRTPGLAAKDRVIWTFKPTLPPVPGQTVSWWEGSPNVGPDGTIYQGNTGGAAYAINPDGTQKFAFQAGNSVWTPPALNDAGETFWGSVDTAFYGLNPQGEQLWKRSTLGYVTSSPALDQRGTLYAGSFDSNFYALDAASGSVKWKFPTGNHIYSSPALIEAPDGAPQQVIFGSTDGLLYSVSPEGSLQWSFDTGAPIRSSIAVGTGPDGRGHIAYFGAANGLVYAIDTDSGSLRWSFDTTSDDPHLENLKQLNGSPALGKQGVYIGSQDGVVWHVPYDYCLRVPTDLRCLAAKAEVLPAQGMHVIPVDPGGSLVVNGDATISPAGVLVGRVIVRDKGKSIPARLVPVPDPSQLVTLTPPFPAQVSVSGDGENIYIRPRELLKPGTRYRVDVKALTTTGGPRLANVNLGPGEQQPFAASFSVTTGPSGTQWRPTASADRVSGISISRLDLPLPALLPSVNQIGFDFYNWVGGYVPTSNPDRQLIWFIGAQQAGPVLVADPAEQPFLFPMTGEMRDGTFSWSSATGLSLKFEFGPVPVRQFNLGGTLNAAGVVGPDAQLYGQAVCGDIPNYGATMPLTGICDTQGELTTVGTFLGQTVASPATRRVAGLGVGPVTVTPGTETIVSAPITLAAGLNYKASEHFVSILLLAPDGNPVGIDYLKATTTTTDPAGNITGVKVTVPAGTTLPTGTEAVVMTDAFPAHRQQLGGGAS